MKKENAQSKEENSLSLTTHSFINNERIVVKMKRKLVKLLASLLALWMLVACVTMNAYAEDGFADVKEYICAPSQYTNTATGSSIEKTLTENGGIVSLGNFGGYVTYEFAEKIQNSSTNPYGIDFKITGNAFNGAYTTQEPGQVWVSQNGNEWYALAGSEHYEDSVVWDYQLTYKNNGTKSLDYTDNLGNSGETKGSYPIAEKYPTISFSDEDITLGGILLSSQRTASTANGINTGFGYVDAFVAVKNSSVVNPYVADPANNSKDGQFDISWAVDENGYPVKLDWIRFAKVQTATFIDGGAFGEKSTEISKVNLLDKKTESVGKTTINSITVNGKNVELTDGKVIYDIVDLMNEGENTISVTSADSNIYINNTYGAEKVFSSAPAKGLVRIIAQNGEKEPAIYYFKTAKGESTPTEPVEPDSNLEHIIGEDVTVSFSAFDGDVIIPQTQITVSDGLAEQYGYEAAKINHLGNRVDAVTVFDVLVAAHKSYYGESFTKNTAENYLVMNNGFITKAFGKSASSSGFTVNDIMPNDGIENPDWGSYTGFACDTAEVAENDDLTYFFYQDTEYWSDNKAVFSSNEMTASLGEALEINVNAYSLWYGTYSPDKIASVTVPADGVDIFLSDGTRIATTDANGNASIQFDTAGEYTIYVAGLLESDESPVVIDWARVTVSEKEQTELTWWQKVINFLVTCYQKLIEALNKIYTFVFSGH